MTWQWPYLYDYAWSLFVFGMFIQLLIYCWMFSRYTVWRWACQVERPWLRCSPWQTTWTSSSPWLTTPTWRETRWVGYCFFFYFCSINSQWSVMSVCLLDPLSSCWSVSVKIEAEKFISEHFPPLRSPFFFQRWPPKITYAPTILFQTTEIFWFAGYAIQSMLSQVKINDVSTGI